MIREPTPVDEEGNPAANPRRIEATAEFQRTAMWQMIGGLQAGRPLFLR
jgi:hypothetical protein